MYHFFQSKNQLKIKVGEDKNDGTVRFCFRSNYCSTFPYLLEHKLDYPGEREKFEFVHNRQSMLLNIFSASIYKQIWETEKRDKTAEQLQLSHTKYNGAFHRNCSFHSDHVCKPQPATGSLCS